MKIRLKGRVNSRTRQSMCSHHKNDALFVFQCLCDSVELGYEVSGKSSLVCEHAAGEEGLQGRHGWGGWTLTVQRHGWK